MKKFQLDTQGEAFKAMFNQYELIEHLLEFRTNEGYKRVDLVRKDDGVYKVFRIVDFGTNEASLHLEQIHKPLVRMKLEDNEYKIYVMNTSSSSQNICKYSGESRSTEEFVCESNKIYSCFQDVPAHGEVLFEAGYLDCADVWYWLDVGDEQFVFTRPKEEGIIELTPRPHSIPIQEDSYLLIAVQHVASDCTRVIFLADKLYHIDFNKDGRFHSPVDVAQSLPHQHVVEWFSYKKWFKGELCD